MLCRQALTDGPAKPPLALVEQLEEEITTLREARQRLATVEAMNLLSDPAAARAKAATKAAIKARGRASHYSTFRLLT